MRFTKMHGAGNDYVYVDCFHERMPDDPGELARRVSDRHFGIGGDGLVLICPAESADARMRMFNADGSEAEMCGNAIRCVAKYVYERGIARKKGVEDRDRKGRSCAGIRGRERRDRAGAGRHGRADPGAGDDSHDPAGASRRGCSPGDCRADVSGYVRFDGQPPLRYLRRRVDGRAGVGHGAEDRARPAFPQPRERRICQGLVARRGPHAGLGTGCGRDPCLRDRRQRRLRGGSAFGANRARDRRPPARRDPPAALGRRTIMFT
jgi:hypothetical protein